MKNLSRIILLLMVCASALASPWDSWRTAYSCFEQGESFRDKGDYLQALKSFESALANYQAVKKARPDWNQRVIAMRMERCRTECEKMRRLLGKNAPEQNENANESSRGIAAAPALPQRSGDSVELRQAKTQLQQAALELRELRRKQETSRKFENEIANLMRDLRISKEEYALLSRKCKVLEERLKNPDNGSEEIKKQLIESAARYERLKKQYDSVHNRMRSFEESMLNQSGLRNAAENAVLKLRSDNEKLSKNIEEMRENLASSASKIKILEHDLKEAERQRKELERQRKEIEQNSEKIAANASAADASSQELTRQINKAKADLERQNILFRDAVKKQNDAEQRLAVSGEKLSALQTQLASTKQLLEHERNSARVAVKEVEQLRNIKNSLETELARVSGELQQSEKRVSERNSKDFIALTKAEQRLRLLREELDNCKNDLIKYKVSSKDGETAKQKLTSENEKLQQELRNITAERNMLAEQDSKQRAKLIKLENAHTDLQKLQKNFEALSAENRENRRLIEAAKPREAEFSRIKLRLAELDRLNASLSREQRLSEELKSSNRKLQEKLAETANVRNEFYAARKRLTELEPLVAEVEKLKKLNTELADAKKFEPQVIALKAKIATLEPATRELENIRKLNARMVSERNELEKEISRIRNMHTGTQLLDGELKELRKKYDELVNEKNSAEHRSEQLRTRLAALENIDKECERQKQINKQLLAMVPRPEEMQSLKESKAKVSELEKRLAAKDEFEKELLTINSKMKEELSKLRLTVGEIQAKYGDVVAKNVDAAKISAADADKARILELENIALKKQLAVAAENEKKIKEKQKTDYSNLQKIVSGTSANVAALEARCVELEAELKKSANELEAVRSNNRSVDQVKFELGVLKKRNLELVDENTLLKNRVRNADNSISELNRLKAETANLRQLALQLEKAKVAESELAALKLKYSEYEQLKEELSRVNRLNRELYARRDVLEKELREQAKFGVDRAKTPFIKVKGRPEDFTNSGKIAEADGNLELARWNYEEALKINPEYKEAMKRAAYLALRRGEFSRSSDLLSRLREKDPANRALAMDLAKSYTGEKRYGNALAVLESVRGSQSDNVVYHELISDVFAGTGRFEDAEKSLKMALRLKKDDPGLLIKLAKVIVGGSATRNTEAASLYEIARAKGASADIDLEPKLGKMLDERRDFEMFLFEAALEAERNNDYLGCQWYYRQLIELGRNKDKYVPRMAFARYMCDDSSAIETLAFNTKTPLGCMIMTLIYLRQNDYKNAVQSSREAKYLNKGKAIVIPDDWYNLAVELKVRLQSADRGVRGVLSENFVTK